MNDMLKSDDRVQSADMDYKEFFQRFMGACRIKHLRREPRLLDLVKDFLKPSRRSRPGNPFQAAHYRVPSSSELPAFFIRLDPWEIEYVFALASRARRGILEVGRAHGGSAFLMACANRRVPIWSIDIQPANDEVLKAQLGKSGIGSNIELIVGDSQNTKYPSIGEVDLLFIDGDHSYDGCSKDLENWFPQVVPGGHVVLHDCYFGCEVQPAVIDFIERHRDAVEVVQSPYIPVSHWRQPAGSLAHFIKRG